jgi:hypothetical protein
MAVGTANAVAHGGRRGAQRLVVKSDKFSNGSIILQNDLKMYKKFQIMSSTLNHFVIPWKKQSSICFPFCDK